jgi:hypothetical protein
MLVWPCVEPVIEDTTRTDAEDEEPVKGETESRSIEQLFSVRGSHEV